MRRSTAPVALSSFAVLLSTSACRVDWSERTTGAVIGGAGGAVVGGLIGSAVGATATGVILGAAAGAAAGYIIGDRIADRREGAPAGAPPPAYARTTRPSTDDTPPELGPVVPPPSADVATASLLTPARAPSTVDAREIAAREYEAGLRSATDQEALGHFDAAMRLDAGRPEPHNARGVVLLRMGRRVEARSAFVRSVTLDPSYAPARENLTRLDAASR